MSDGKRELHDTNLDSLPLHRDEEILIISTGTNRHRDILNKCIGGYTYYYCFIRLTIALAASDLLKSSFIASSLYFSRGFSSMIFRLLFIRNSR
jgi:hypothetical protein